MIVHVTLNEARAKLACLMRQESPNMYRNGMTSVKGMNRFLGLRPLNDGLDEC